MQSAKKLVLLDEFDREYKRLQRSADAVAKTDRSLQLPVTDTLRNQSFADDRKVREYVTNLYRYLNTRKQIPDEPVVVANTQTPPPPERRPARRRRARRPWTPL